jgi:UDP-N-acetylglucosamine--N-acetylmuramyl-(pentapeptide) pyrophosphoryl-undecaprenol N-acetylglucosamine transferase
LSPDPRPLVGLYVHDSPGAVARARAVVPHLTAKTVLLSRASLDGPGFGDLLTLRLPPPAPGSMPLVDPAADAVLGGDLVARVATWVQQETPDLLVVDGPLDLALVGAVCGVPTVPLRRMGRPVGPGHVATHHLAASWLAPYPAALEPADTPMELRQRTVHAGFLSPFEGRRLGVRAARRKLGLDEDARHVTIVAGQDGMGIRTADLVAAADAAVHWTFSVLGRVEGGAADHPRVHLAGWRDDPLPHLIAADVVVSGASLSVVADVAAVERPLAVIPASRRDDEEVRLAGALEEAGAATVLDAWPGAMAWPALLADLLDQPTRPMKRLADGRAARRAAEWIDAWALSAPVAPATELARVERRPAVIDVRREPVPEEVVHGRTGPLAVAAEP